MITLRLFASALIICFFASCTSRNNQQSNSQPDEQEIPGIGMAPDSSKNVADSTIERQQGDTASRRQQ